MNNRYYRNVLELLEERFEKTPDAVAFGDVKRDITYRELYYGARFIGSFFSDKIKHRDAVAFYMEKSCSALVGMLGVVYAGGFYSFLDVRQPASRIDKIIEKLDPKVIFTDSEMLEKSKELTIPKGAEVVLLDEIISYDPKRVDNRKLAQIRSKAQDIDPLYVNFTSGSTGVPKGVTVSHRSVLEFISYFTEIFGIRSGDVMGNQAPFDFDVSVKDIYSGLMTGAKVQLIPREYFSNPTKLMDYLADKKVTVLVWAVSAMCFVAIMNGLEYRRPENIRMIMFSGEVMPIKHLNHWKKFYPEATYVNLYGPTEITCNCTYHVLDREYELTEAIPAGIPFPNEHVFLLDEEDKEVVAPGEVGEICVTGTSLALGYFGDEEKTKAAFMQNPLNKFFNEEMYRTGDLGKFGEDGLLYYVSRKDFQIKHLGQRIELGEIEVAAMAVEGAERACCLYDNDKKKIVLFYSGELDKKELVGNLKESLPQFMVPSAVRQMEELPLNKNGKIDRQKLKSIYEEK